MKEDFRTQLKKAAEPLEEVIEERPPELSAAEVRQLSSVMTYLKKNYFKEEEK